MAVLTDSDIQDGCLRVQATTSARASDLPKTATLPRPKNRSTRMSLRTHSRQPLTGSIGGGATTSSSVTDLTVKSRLPDPFKMTQKGEQDTLPELKASRLDLSLGKMSDPAVPTTPVPPLPFPLGSEAKARVPPPLRMPAYHVCTKPRAQ